MNFCFILTLYCVIKISVFLLQAQVNYISQLQAKFNDLQRYAVTTEEVNERELICIKILWSKSWLTINGWHFAPYHFSLMYGFQQEPLYWYLRTLISLGVFHLQLVGFSDKIIAYQPGLFCVVMLLARWMQPQQRWEKLNEKIRKSKTLSMQHTFWQDSCLALHD